MDYFAVIDTETNWNNEVMSIGVVIAEKDTFKKVDDLYFIFDPEYKIGGMFSIKVGRVPRPQELRTAWVWVNAFL